MKKVVPGVLLILAIATTLFAVFGGESYSKLFSMRRALLLQKEKNGELKTQVLQLRRQVRSLQEDDRSLEKAARNELGLARPKDFVFIFESKKDEQR